MLAAWTFIKMSVGFSMVKEGTSLSSYSLGVVCFGILIESILITGKVVEAFKPTSFEQASQIDSK